MVLMLRIWKNIITAVTIVASESEMGNDIHHAVEAVAAGEEQEQRDEEYHLSGQGEEYGGSGLAERLKEGGGYDLKSYYCEGYHRYPEATHGLVDELGIGCKGPGYVPRKGQASDLSDGHYHGGRTDGQPVGAFQSACESGTIVGE